MNENDVVLIMIGTWGTETKNVVPRVSWIVGMYSAQKSDTYT